MCSAYANITIKQLFESVCDRIKIPENEYIWNRRCRVIYLCRFKLQTAQL